MARGQGHLFFGEPVAVRAAAGAGTAGVCWRCFSGPSNARRDWLVAAPTATQPASAAAAAISPPASTTPARFHFQSAPAASFSRCAAASVRRSDF